MKAETVAAKQVLNFLVARRKGSDEKPVTFGNVDFWHEVPGYVAGILCYSIPTSRWDLKAVQADLNRDAKDCWPELMAHLGAEPQATP